MPALIPELIAMASDPTVKTTDLLRKAMVAARLLKQPEWATWIDHELQGYPQSGDLPPYRVLQGELKVDVPGHGRLPLPIRGSRDFPSKNDKVLWRPRRPRPPEGYYFFGASHSQSQ